MQITQLIASLAAAGGLGFINYYIMTRMDVITLEGRDEKLIKPALMFFSIFDYIIYLLSYASISHFRQINSNVLIAFSLFITIIFSIILTVLFSNCAFKLIDKLINKQRTNNSLAISKNNDCWNFLIDTDKFVECYIYSLVGDFIANGYLSHASKNINSQYDLILEPYKYEIDRSKIIENMNDKEFMANHDIKEYVNLDKNITIYFVFKK